MEATRSLWRTQWTRSAIPAPADRLNLLWYRSLTKTTRQAFGVSTFRRMKSNKLLPDLSTTFPHAQQMANSCSTLGGTRMRHDCSSLKYRSKAERQKKLHEVTFFIPRFRRMATDFSTGRARGKGQAPCRSS